jgi:nitrite reductase/ring-hydroxylating ferredoxin subunit/uncharacterized membrane protein
MVVRDELVTQQLETVVEQLPALDEGARSLASLLHAYILEGGENTRRLADLLHGTWLGHPLHPVLTDVTIGSWLFGTLFDVLAIFPFMGRMRRAADTLLTLGTIAAVPTALTGLTDYSGIKRSAAKYGAVHGILNTLSFLAYFRSVRLRSGNNRFAALLFSLVGLSIATLSAYIGGDMVYRLNVGTNHAKKPAEPEQWTAVMPESDLGDQQPTRVQVDGEPVLLYRKYGTVYAIGAVCSHAGGPLEQGTFYDFCVQCPWHDSVFDLRNGNPVHGPTTYRQPAYRARINNGQIEIMVGS